MILRKIVPTDNIALAKLIRNVFEEYQAPKTGTVYADSTTDHLYELFQRQDSILWVATSADQIMGCCGIYPTEGLPEHCTELVKFYLSPQSRGLGIGKSLMEASINSAKELGYTQIYLESLPAFSNAVNMYKKQGFVTLSQPLGNSGHSNCDIWMLKHLQ